MRPVHIAPRPIRSSQRPTNSLPWPTPIGWPRREMSPIRSQRRLRLRNAARVPRWFSPGHRPSHQASHRSIPSRRARNRRSSAPIVAGAIRVWKKRSPAGPIGATCSTICTKACRRRIPSWRPMQPSCSPRRIARGRVPLWSLRSDPRRPSSGSAEPRSKRSPTRPIRCSWLFCGNSSTSWGISPEKPPRATFPKSMPICSARWRPPSHATIRGAAPASSRDSRRRLPARPVWCGGQRCWRCPIRRSARCPPT